VEIFGLKNPFPKINNARPVQSIVVAAPEPEGRLAQANNVNCPIAINIPPTKIDFLLPQYLSAM
jgi:hypothetical protein